MSPRYGSGDYPRYVPVAARRARAARKIAKMGRDVAPVVIEGRRIATTFWGEAWCKNLESYSDYENRLPRGRTYVRNGSVVDLQIAREQVQAHVMGTSMYKVRVGIRPVAAERWSRIKAACGGQIGSLVELLRGSISGEVMDIVTRRDEGLFPAPGEITLGCSCPDWATMCKHVAAAMYGVGARLDAHPELLFTLRGVDPEELVQAAIERAPAVSTSSRRRRLADEELSSLFGIDVDVSEQSATPRRARARKAASKRAKANKPAKKKSVAKPSAAKKSTAKKATAKPTTGKKARAKAP